MRRRSGAGVSWGYEAPRRAGAACVEVVVRSPCSKTGRANARATQGSRRLPNGSHGIAAALQQITPPPGPLCTDRRTTPPRGENHVLGGPAAGPAEHRPASRTSATGGGRRGTRAAPRSAHRRRTAGAAAGAWPLPRRFRRRAVRPSLRPGGQASSSTVRFVSRTGSRTRLTAAGPGDTGDTAQGGPCHLPAGQKARKYLGCVGW